MDKRQRAQYLMRIKKGILTECVLLVLAVAVLAGQKERMEERRAANNPILAVEDGYIKWVDFTVSYEALCNAYEWDVKTHGTEHEVHWVELLAYHSCRPLFPPHILPPARRWRRHKPPYNRDNTAIFPSALPAYSPPRREPPPLFPWSSARSYQKFPLSLPQCMPAVPPSVPHAPFRAVECMRAAA